MNSPRLPPLGNKPLPKISYGKLNNKPATRASKQNANDHSYVAGDGMSDKEHIKSQSSTFLMPHNERQNAGSSFRRFAVLPPIPGRQRSARDSQTSLILPNYCTNDNWRNGTLNAEQGNYFGNVVSDKRRGSGFVATSQRRASCINHDSVSTCQVGHNNDLEIVGNALGNKIQSRNDKDRQSFDTAGGTPPTSGQSTGVNAQDYAAKNHGKLVASDRSTNWVGDEPQFPRKGRKSSEALNIQRHNSDISDISSFLSANDAMDVSTNSNKLLLSLPQSTARPLSRGQISFAGFEDVELLKGNQKTSVQERRKSFGRLSISMPVIQIDGASEINNNNNNSSFNNNNEDARETASASQAATNWQLLIDSLENAKDEVPKQSIGVPYTSLREKRRRSALCRNNSKQVDDFLLVHNLRDLGLL